MNLNKSFSKRKVSVIVPAYNVEKYLFKCINSILNQTYRNIEVIIINDGSTDGTLKILKEIKKQDNRVKIINKNNEGVSAARNDGISAACGEYLIFVDADDYIATDYVEYMLNLIDKTGAEFCISTNCFTRKDEKQIKNDEVSVLMPEEAVAFLLSPRVIVGCWNKIYSASFVKKNSLQFLSNLFYGEGLFFITNAAQLATCVGVGNRKVYYYRRNNETSATTKFDIEKLRNGEKALIAIKENISLKNKKIDSMWNLHISLFSLGAITKMKTNEVDTIYKEDYLHWKKILTSKLFTLLKSRNVSLYRKLMLVCGMSCPGVVARIDVKRRKKISYNSVK